MNVGDKAPEILGLNEKGEEIRLSNYKGKKIVWNYEDESWYIRHYYQPNGEGYAPTDRSISISKTSNESIRNLTEFSLIDLIEFNLLNEILAMSEFRINLKFSSSFELFIANLKLKTFLIKFISSSS